jgi:hypothetical protein
MTRLAQLLPSNPVGACSIRRRLQFSLRSLMVVLTAACLVAGWWMDNVWRQHHAVEAILKAGGYVRYPIRSLRKLKPYERRSFYVTGNDDHFWSDFVSSPVGVGFEDTQVNDELFRHVSTLSHLHSFQSNGRVSDFGLAALSRLKELTWLQLDGARIDDPGLVYLKTLHQIEVIGITDSEITDGGLQHLIGLKKLTVLYLKNTKVTETGESRFKNTVPTCHLSVGNVQDGRWYH